MTRAWRVLLLGVTVACSGASPSGSPAQPPPPPPPPPAPAPDAALPDAAPAQAKGCVGDPPRPDWVCVRDCGEPVQRAGDPEPGWSWMSPENAEKRRLYGCPKCLPADARIATPSGEVAVSQLRPGALVWSRDDHGRPVARRVEHVASTPAPRHTILVIELDDGRVLRASAGHPDAGGRPIGLLRPGAPLDGATVRDVRRAAYSGSTWDIALEQGARHYLADGVWVQTSLPARD